METKTETKPKTICLDTETTGVRPTVDEVLTLSIVGADGEVLLDRLFKPERTKEWPRASQINGIYPEDVEECDPIGDSVDEINAILAEADEIVGYNLSFDLDFLENAGITARPPHAKLIDVMPTFAQIYGDWNPRRRDYRWQKLTTAADFIGHEWTGAAHGSLADARATLAVHEWCEEIGRTRDVFAAVMVERCFPEKPPSSTIADIEEFMDEEHGKLSATQREAVIRLLSRSSPQTRARQSPATPPASGKC